MTFQPGLENVVAAETVLSDVDGERGRLVIAGAEVDRLEGGLEEIARALWTAVCLDGAAMVAGLGAARALAFGRISSLGAALTVGSEMDALRAAVAQLPSSADPVRDAIAVSGAVAVFAAALGRVRRGLEPIAPDPSARHAHDVLRMVTGSPPTEARARALDRYLMTVSDHGMNASTFVARVVASTGSDTISAVVGALGALKGPLHGGAPGPVLDMLEAIGSPERAAGWVSAELDAGRRIMGMGHRIYRVRDPRAAVLERAISELEREESGATGRLPLARAVEREATRELAKRHPERPLAANVEFYTAVLLDAVGLPRTLFTPAFAVGRVIGWTAHVAEQARTGRLMRPQSRYVGTRAS